MTGVYDKLCADCRDSNYGICEKHFEDFKIDKKNYTILNVKRNDLNKELHKIDIGVFFAKQNFSILASFPTKIAEFLMSGIPILCNNFNEDIYNLISDYKIGLIYSFEKRSFEKNFYSIISMAQSNKIKLECYETSKKLFTIKRAVYEYRKIYNKLMTK